jgi:outer membrane protein assembly factor BamA
MVDAATLLQARRYLTATGLFTEVDLYTMRGSRLGTVIAVVDARPSHRFYLATGVGRDPFRGAYVNVASLRRMGLFGRGGIARVTFRLAQRDAGLYADLEVPALLPRETDLLLDLGRYRQTWTIHQGDSTRFQKSDVARFRVGARHRLTDDVSALLSAGISQTRPRPSLSSHDDHPKIPAADLLTVYKDDLRLGEVQLSLTRDRPDQLRPWQSGSWEGLVLRGASPRDGERFWGSEFDAIRAFPVAGTRAAASTRSARMRSAMAGAVFSTSSCGSRM